MLWIVASRTGVKPCRRREREATYCNSTELSGMDSTLPHLKIKITVQHRLRSTQDQQ